MYKDYYKILGLHYSTTQEDIKKKYRELAKKWHPDVNQNEDATSKMQEITEAYLLLSDEDARKRYDIIHEQLFRPKEESKSGEEYKNYFEEKEFESKTSHVKSDAGQNNNVVADQILEKWILNAREQAKDFVIESIKDAKGIVANGCKYTLYAIGITILLFFIILIILSVIGSRR